MRILYTCIFFALTHLSIAQNARLKIYLDPITETLLNEIGVEKDHGEYKRGHYLITDFTALERQKIKESGIRYEVLIDDVTAFYQQRSKMESAARSSRAACFDNAGDSVQTPEGWALGSMGGFYTYEEFLAHLDTMAARFPNLISARQPIDTFLSHEQRPIYWLKISDNPNINETEPEVMYNAIHHAREPESLTQLVFYMYYLLENYGTDEEVTYLVDNTEMYFVPVLNPDGYVYNQTTDPNGGGLWRKNRLDNGDGTMGVDLNRNYGYFWGLDNAGSSPTTSSETYRGSAAFSEPETRAMKWFCEQNEFGLALNYHAFGNYLIYPWGYTAALSPDSVSFSAIASTMVAQNNYTAGTGFETVGYLTNGVSDDWMYAEEAILAMTPEVGGSGDGFWPAQNRIEPIAQENVTPNLLAAHFVGNYISVKELSASVLPNLIGQLPVEVTRLGLQFNVGHSVNLIPVSSNIISSTSTQSINAINLGEVQTFNLDYELNANTPLGATVEFDLEVVIGSYSHIERITKIYGQSTIAMAAPTEITEFNTLSWGITDEDFTTAPTSFTDSPDANHSNNAFSEIEYRRVLDLTNAQEAFINFDTKWELEAGYDYVQVLVSPLTSESYSPACGTYSKEGNVNQDFGQPLWDGIQNTWVKENINLTDYLGQKVKLKFRLVSDAFVNYDGFYFDDLQLTMLLDPAFTGAIDTGYWDTLGASGIVEGMGEMLWSIYPNPAAEQITIKSKTNQKADVLIIDMLGHVVLRINIQSQAKINTSDLSSGIYLVEIRTENGREVHRLVKE